MFVRIAPRAIVLGIALLVTACGTVSASPTAVGSADPASAAQTSTATPTPTVDETAEPSSTLSPEPASEYTIPGADEEELAAADLTQDEITDIFLGGSGLGVSVDEFVTAWNSDDEIQAELVISNLALEPVDASGFAITQHFFSDTLGLLLLTDEAENLRSALLLGERGATGDIVDDGMADLQHSFAESYFVASVNPRLDEFERNNLMADMMDLDEIVAGGLDGLREFYSSPLREMIVVKSVRYDMARDESGVLYLIATGE